MLGVRLAGNLYDWISTRLFGFIGQPVRSARGGGFVTQAVFFGIGTDRRQNQPLAGRIDSNKR